MLAYDFMQNAFAASGIVAVVAGLVGYFLLNRPSEVGEDPDTHARPGAGLVKG